MGRNNEIRKCFGANKVNPNFGKILITLTRNNSYAEYDNWFSVLKKSFKEVINFDRKWTRIYLGETQSNKLFLKVFEKEKPDFVSFGMTYSVQDFDVLLKMREIYPRTKIFTFFADDDILFDNFSRYSALFYDFSFVDQIKYVSKYKEEAIKSIFPFTIINTDFFKPLNIKKEYDVVFIGVPKGSLSGRYEYIKFLKDNGVKLRLFGWVWGNYPEFKDIYGGPLETKEMVKVINQSKIYLCLSKNDYGQPHFTGKFFEGAACKTFVLTEYCKDYLDLFQEGKDMVMFKDKEDLLQKINYYLKNDSKRDKIAENAYQKISRRYNLYEETKEVFKKVHSNPSKFNFKGLSVKDYKIRSLSKEDMDTKELKIMLNDYDYVFFDNKKAKSSKYRKYLQAYSLKISGKPISCCDYLVSSFFLGEYLQFYSNISLRNLDKLKFNQFLNINQLMVTKDYFLENFNIFKNAFDNGKIDFIEEKNTVFISFPLIKLKTFTSDKLSVMEKAFKFKFLESLYSLNYRKKLFFSPYPYALFFKSLKANFFILQSIFKNLADKDKMKRLTSFEKNKNNLEIGI